MVMEKELLNQENYRTEYKEVAATYRLHVSLRFIVAAFAATLQSALLNTYKQSAEQKSSSQNYDLVIPIIGIVTIFAIFIIEWRTISVFRALMRRGKELELNLGLLNGHFSWLSAREVVQPRRWKRFLTHTWGISLVYGIISVLWIILFIFRIKGQ